jgi:hypothetical protein
VGTTLPLPQICRLAIALTERVVSTRLVDETNGADHSSPRPILQSEHQCHKRDLATMVLCRASTCSGLSATEIVTQTTAGKLSCEEIARACLARIDAREPVVKAWSFIDPELILQRAKALDGYPKRGPLHGVPVGIKDIIDTCDMPTEMGSPIYRGYRSKSDASCVGGGCNDLWKDRHM